jgi:hypothetical protein
VVSHNGFEDALFEAEVMRVLDQHSNATTTTHAEAALAQHDNSSSIGSTGEVAEEEEVAPLFLFWAPHSVHSPLQVPAPYLHQARKRHFFAPFIYKMHYFTKTGSGRT